MEKQKAIELNWCLGKKSKEGNRQFNLLHFAYGKKCFGIIILGICITIKIK